MTKPEITTNIENDRLRTIEARFRHSVRTSSQTMFESAVRQEEIVADLIADTEHLRPALWKQPLLADVIVIAKTIPQNEAEAEQMVAERVADINKYAPLRSPDEHDSQHEAQNALPRMRSYMR